MAPESSGVEPVLAAPARLVRPASDEFRQAGLALLRALPPGEGRLVLDLSRTDDADSVGMAALITLRRRARATGARLILRGMRPAFEQLMHLARLEGHFETEP
jgi:anti-anti-sigma regulatory factor